MPAAVAHVWRLDAVVDAVADHVHERIGDLLDDLAIELGVLAAEHELDRLVRLAPQVADDAGDLLERLADRHHAQRHRAALQVGGDALQLAEVAGQPRVDARRQHRVFLDQRLHDDQLADGVDEAIQLARVDLDRGVLVRRGEWRRRRGLGSADVRLRFVASGRSP